MKVARENRKKTYFFMIFKVLFLKQFSSNLYMLYAKIIVYSYEIHTFLIVGQNFSFTWCPLKNVFWISSAIPKITVQNMYFFFA